jgi:hypothetical protein
MFCDTNIEFIEEKHCQVTASLLAKPSVQIMTRKNEKVFLKTCLIIKCCYTFSGFGSSSG